MSKGLEKQTEEKMNAKQIITEAGLSSYPGYYKGVGGRSLVLNEEVLGNISNRIKKYYGEKANENFAQMVKETSELSVEAFLYKLYKLERFEWDWEKAKKNNYGNND